MDGQGQLVQIVTALHARRRLADLLHGRQEQANEDGNDGDDHQQFDQREGRAASAQMRRGRGAKHAVTPRRGMRKAIQPRIACARLQSFPRLWQREARRERNFARERVGPSFRFQPPRAREETRSTSTGKKGENVPTGTHISPEYIRRRITILTRFSYFRCPAPGVCAGFRMMLLHTNL